MALGEADPGAGGGGETDNFQVMARGGDPDNLVRAAGGLVIMDRRVLSVVVVHRPHHGDWSFPKGKHEPDEDDERCAWREVLEETGYDCVLLGELGETRYVDDRGRPKLVRYFIMEPRGGDFVPNDEVDLVMTVPLDELGEVLTYPHDVELAGRLPAALEELGPPAH